MQKKRPQAKAAFTHVRSSHVLSLIAYCGTALALVTAVPSQGSAAAQRLTTPRIAVYKIPTPGERAVALTTDGDGDIWFLEEPTKRGKPQVGRITPAGQISEFPAPISGGSTPQSIAGSGSVLLYDEFPGAALGRVEETGDARLIDPAFPSGSSLTGMTATSGRSIWAGLSNVVQAPGSGQWYAQGYLADIDPQTGLLNTYPIPNPTPAGVGPSGVVPQALAPASSGGLWFTTGAGEIGRATSRGAITQYPVETSTTIFGGVTEGPFADAWFTAQPYEKPNYIGRLSQGGRLTKFPALGMPWAITGGADGNLWYGATTALVRMTPAGESRSYPIPTSGTSTYTLVAGPHSTLWFDEWSASGQGWIGKVQL